MGMPGVSEWMIILAIAVLLFGGKKLPELGRAVGESIRNFKRGVADDGSEQSQAKASQDKFVLGASDEEKVS